MARTQDERPTAPLSGDIPSTEGSIVHRATLPAREGASRDPSTVLPADLADPFRTTYGELFAHQASALEALAEGENVVVTTETASGKTFVYALEIARRRYRDPDTTALLVFPTKALARDQERELNDLYTALGLDLTVRVYDGDTPTERRRHIRETADVVITNFVGLNLYLPHHRRWGALFGDCEVVAIDEAHAYTGVFGMNVAWTVRRLRRVLAHHGADPSFVATSATIGNPGEHARRLTGLPVTVVDEDGSPRGRRDIAFWQPPAGQDEVAADVSFAERSAAGTSPVREAAGILAHLGLAGDQTLMFSRSRKSAELGAKYARRAAEAHPKSGEIAVEPYHAGLGKETRRGTEHQLTAGQLDGVSSTNALELGIDIGSMDATVLTGYPGTRQSFWQQMGRAGRGECDARSVFVAGDDAIDQYLLDEPEYVLEGPVEDAVVGLENNPIYAQHLLAAANELPLTEADRSYFDGDRLARAVEMWRKAGRLEGDLDRGVRYTGSPRPEADISMYGAGGHEFEVICENGDIDMEPVARERAYRDHHEGALFLHDGVQYEVTALVEDVSHPYLTVRAVDVDAYTETHSEKTVRDLEPEETRDLGEGYRLAWGMGTVEID
ncbi:MAG: DEAD/DEAH box helicase, partial [Halodesulfurarchaeum sp.]